VQPNNGIAVSAAAEAATAKTMALMLFPSFFMLRLAFLQLQPPTNGSSERGFTHLQQVK
jgi:hypothetical protein